MPGRGGSNPPTSGSADPDEGIMASNNEEPTISRGDGRTTRQDVLDALIAEQEELEKKAKSGQTLSKEERERKNRIAGEIKDMEGLILESPESGQLAMMSAPINNKKS